MREKPHDNVGSADDGVLIGRPANLARFPLVWTSSHWCGFSLGASRFKLGDFALYAKNVSFILHPQLSGHIHLWLFWSKFWKKKIKRDVRRPSDGSEWFSAKKFRYNIRGNSVENIQQGERDCATVRKDQEIIISEMWDLLRFAAFNALFWLMI